MSNANHSPSRRQIVQAGLASAALLPWSVNVRAQQTYTMRVAHVEAMGSPLTDSLDKWTKVLKEKSGGRHGGVCCARDRGDRRRARLHLQGRSPRR